MRKLKSIALLLCLWAFATAALAQKYKTGNLKVVIIRHAEKPASGDNLNCQGFNRSLALPKVLASKFGTSANILVPSLGQGKSTAHSRMFQTITPFAVKYNLKINTNFDSDDYKGINEYLEGREGTILMVWDHSNIKALVKSFGVKTAQLKWNDNDFDSIWIVNIKGKKASMVIDHEDIADKPGCNF